MCLSPVDYDVGFRSQLRRGSLSLLDVPELRSQAEGVVDRGNSPIKSGKASSEEYNHRQRLIFISTRGLRRKW